MIIKIFLETNLILKLLNELHSTFKFKFHSNIQFSWNKIKRIMIKWRIENCLEQRYKC